MRRMKTILKGLGIPPLLLCYALMSGILFLAPAGRKKKRAAAVRLSSLYARIFLRLLGIRVRVKHRERLHPEGGARLLVSNHLSYVDVLVISSLLPSVFITSVELKNTALLGTLARLSGSIFVERRRPSGLKREIADISRALDQGMPVALFPEGTTSNGDLVMPFKISLFDAAVTTQADIVPICIRYLAVNKERLSPGNRDAVFYYGGSTFPKHLLRFLTLSSIEVEIVLLKVIKTHAPRSRKELASEAHAAISAAYRG